ncbi:hypothetical protein ERO13_D13G163532v2 [Gossypium hirsutum]|uniref:Uncharacterized protein n=2 Tax=Gossypium TaxID=3633 RepID=A0A5J5NP38_GOSBA|nr:hypothetical protein ES319_D13G187000v1 [Gossypium barbadense]KAG4112457.1 hypothetical protein ERO13_D13G163532v2 [Gossypium hirsutum]TYI47680.1 hypothetical protein E1A91_D13G191000v1 [Gossypium mustelinum]
MLDKRRGKFLASMNGGKSRINKKGRGESRVTKFLKFLKCLKHAILGSLLIPSNKRQIQVHHKFQKEKQ